MKLDAVDRAALQLWIGWRLAVAVLGAATAGVVRAGQDGYSWVDRWNHWDAVHFVGIAQQGYGGEPTGVPNEAFLPGLPLLMRAGASLGLPEVVVGLGVSVVAGAVAAVALARLAERVAPGAGGWTVAAFLLAPTAVFLAAPYTEALFLAFALPAWLAALDRRWMAAGLLATAAMTVRVSGLFLVAALVVQWATTRPRRPSDLAWLALPAVPLAVIVAVQRASTGSWLAWWEAQSSAEWSRSARPPWETAQNTWDAAFAGTVGDQYVWPFRLELVAIVIGLVVAVWCLRRQAWGEATFMALNVAAFSFSFWFLSVPRAALLWWPLWIAVGSLIMRHPWVRVGWLGVSGALAAAWAVAFFSGAWAG